MEVQHTKAGTPYVYTGRYEVLFLNGHTVVASLHKSALFSNPTRSRGFQFRDADRELFNEFVVCVDADEFNHLAKRMIAGQR